MDNRLQNFFIGSMKKICNSKQVGSPPISKGSCIEWSYNGFGFTLADNDLQLYKELVATIMRSSQFNKSVAKKDIEEELRLSIAKIYELDESKKLQAIIDEISSFEARVMVKMKIWDILIPIENLSIKPQVIIFNNIKFFTFSKYQKSKYFQFYKNLINSNKYYKENEAYKKRLLESTNNDLGMLLNKTCASIKKIGSLNFAEDEALKTLDTALSCFKLFSSNKEFLENRFHIAGEYLNGGNRAILAFNEEKEHFNQSIELLKVSSPYLIDKDKLLLMKKVGLNKLQKMLSSKNNSLDDKIINSVYWFSKSFDVLINRKANGEKDTNNDSIQDDKWLFFNIGDKFLKLIISLECLLIFNHENKSVNIPNRCAYLLSEDEAERKSIKEFLKQINIKRNKVVHEGNCAISIAETIRLKNYVQDSILTIINNQKKWKIFTEEDLYQWFERKRLLERTTIRKEEKHV